MDVSMPKMDGLQASQLISATAPHTPILLYTSYDLSPSEISRAKKLGVWQVLAKRGAPDELLRTAEALHADAVAKAPERVRQTN
jgi:DNA-binding NarL/FixJ family response regulator